MKKTAQVGFSIMAVLMLASVLVLSGCGGGGGQQAQGSGGQQASGTTATNATDNPWTNGQDLSGTTVNIFGAFVGTDAENFNQSMKPFEDQTGIDIKYEGSGDFESLITVRTEGGDAPDIADFPQPGLMYDMVDRGHVIDLNDWFETSYLQQQYLQSYLDMVTYKGQMAGVWYRASVKSLVWYPHPEFGDAGYKIPQSWDELLALSDQMVKDGHTPWSIGIESSGATGWVATDWMEDIMLRTVTPQKYDDWVTGKLKFDSPEVKRAANLMAKIWFNKDYVLGGTNSILTVPFGDAINPLTKNPPQAWLHRQASFIVNFFPDGIKLGQDMRYFYFPPIDKEQGKPVLIAGDIFSAMQDRPEVRAVMRWLTTGESTKAWVESGSMVAPQKDAKLDWYPDKWARGYAEILQNADTVRFDGSDMMPGAIGTGAFWTGMVNWVNGTPLDTVLKNIDAAWPSSN